VFFLAHFQWLQAILCFPKLTSINYFYWSKRMQPIFINKDLWEFVIDGYDMPFDEEYKALDAT
jgi:hypothetical protein